MLAVGNGGAARHKYPGGAGRSTVLLLDYRLKDDAGRLAYEQRRLIVRTCSPIGSSVRLLPSPTEKAEYREAGYG